MRRGADTDEGPLGCENGMTMTLRVQRLILHQGVVVGYDSQLPNSGCVVMPRMIPTYERNLQQNDIDRTM